MDNPGCACGRPVRSPSIASSPDTLPLHRPTIADNRRAPQSLRHTPTTTRYWFTLARATQRKPLKNGLFPGHQSPANPHRSCIFALPPHSKRHPANQGSEALFWALNLDPMSLELAFDEEGATCWGPDSRRRCWSAPIRGHCRAAGTSTIARPRATLPTGACGVDD